jgi:hypothetical protein
MTLSLSYDPSGGLGVDATDYLWNMYNEHVTQGRHHEAQRTGVTTVVLALAGAVTAFIAQGHLEHAWTLAAFLIALGVLGALFSLKQTERTRLHITVGTAFGRQLELRLTPEDISSAATTPGIPPSTVSSPASIQKPPTHGGSTDDRPWMDGIVPLLEIEKLSRDWHDNRWNIRTRKDDMKLPLAAETGRKKEKRKKKGQPLFHLYWFFVGLNLLVAALGAAIWINI